MKEITPERISIYTRYTEEFTEELYNAAMLWARQNCLGKPRGWEDNYEGLKIHKYFLFDNWGLNSDIYDPISIMYGPDNNRQSCRIQFSVDELKILIGFNTDPSYEIY